MTDTTVLPAFECDELTGAVYVRDQGHEWRFRPPSFGGMRRLDEYLVKVNEDFILRTVEESRQERAEATVAEPETTEAEATEADDEAEVLTVEELEEQALGRIDALKDNLDSVYDNRRIFLGWWRLAAEVCGVDDWPTDDNLPLWLGEEPAATATARHWREFPTRALGVPTTPGAVSSNGTR